MAPAGSWDGHRKCVAQGDSRFGPVPSQVAAMVLQQPKPVKPLLRLYIEARRCRKTDIKKSVNSTVRSGASLADLTTADGAHGEAVSVQPDRGFMNRGGVPSSAATAVLLHYSGKGASAHESRRFPLRGVESRRKVGEPRRTGPGA